MTPVLRSSRFTRSPSQRVGAGAPLPQPPFMRNLILLSALAGSLCAQAQDPMPAVSAGRVERMAAFPSRFVAARNIDVWLPPGYDGRTRCPVIYMHDGHLFMSLFRGGSIWVANSHPIPS